MYVSGARVWASRGRTLLFSEDSGEHFRALGSATMKRGVWAAARLGERLARAGFHGFVETTTTRGVGIVTGGVLRCGADGFGPMFAVRGSRPLSLCRASDGTVYFGEYWGNSNRRPVRVFASRDEAETWQPVYEFAAGAIRHVHSIVEDPHEPGTMYVLTGDENHESAIHRTRDRFTTLEAVASGSQQTRAIAAVPRPEGLYYATDTEREHNAIHLLQRDGRRTQIGLIAGSGFACCTVADRVFFASAAEPSTVNTERAAYIYECVPGQGIRVVARSPKDALPMKLFQYGTFVLPCGPGDGANLWATPWALVGHGTLLRMRLDDR